MCAPEVAVPVAVCNCPLMTKSRDLPPFRQAMSDTDNPKSTDSRESAKVSPLNVSEKIYSTPNGAGRPRLKLHATARNLAGKNRQSGYDLKVAAKSAVEKIFAIYDVDKSGYLDPSELKKLLTKYHDGIPPDDQTVNFIIRMCDHEDVEQGQEQVGIHRNELTEAIGIAKAYMKNEKMINDTFEKYYAQNQNTLDYQQVKQLLTDLNEGKVSGLEARLFRDGHCDGSCFNNARHC